MSILVGPDTKVIVQGITGRAGSLHTAGMLAYGTKIVGGVRPGAGGEEVNGVPVWNKVKAAVAETGANTSVLFVPAATAKGAALEAIAAGIRLLVMVPEHVPPHDTLEILEAAEEAGAMVVGPNTPGLIAPPLKCKLGFMPDRYCIPGQVGIASRSGTLAYEVLARLTAAGIGQSTCVGIGGDPTIGLRFTDLLPMFEADPETKLILLVGEIGGSQEEEAAEMIASGKISKPVIAYIAGKSVPQGKQIGHAGAIISGERGTWAGKVTALAASGVGVAKTLGELPGLINGKMGGI